MNHVSQRIGSRLSAGSGIAKHSQLLHDRARHAAVRLWAILRDVALSDDTRDVDEVPSCRIEPHATLIVSPCGRIRKRIESRVTAIPPQVWADRASRENLHHHRSRIRVQMPFGNQSDDLMTLAAPGPCWGTRDGCEQRCEQHSATELNSAADFHPALSRIRQAETSATDSTRQGVRAPLIDRRRSGSVTSGQNWPNPFGG